MPIYTFHHFLPLTKAHKATLARLITDYHSTTFKAPRYIVNCKFVDTSRESPENNWVGGLSMKTNVLDISLRNATSRTEQQYQDITTSLVLIWNKAVQDVQATEADRKLSHVYIWGAIDSAFEMGFFLPMPGKFEEWVVQNKPEFQRLADGGDATFEGLIKEIEERPEFQSSK